MHKEHWNSHITSFIFRLLVLAKNVNCICFLICVDLSARYTCILPNSILGDWHCLRYYYIVCWLNSPNTFLPLFFYSQVMQRFLKSKKKNTLSSPWRCIVVSSVIKSFWPISRYIMKLLHVTCFTHAKQLIALL